MADISKAFRGLSLRQLRTFQALARHRSFTAAARELHVTQPAISMQVRELEQALGLALYERIGRRVELTAAGRELAACAQGVDERLQQAAEQLAAMQGLAAGQLRLGAVSTAKYFAPTLLAAFKAQHPGIGIRFTVGNRQEVIAQLTANDCDLVIMGRPPAELETVASAFAEHPLIMVAAPDHPLATQTGIAIERLAGESFLVREKGSGTRTAMEELFAAHGLPYATAMEVSSNETIKQAVMAGLGLTLISAHTVGLELATGRLVSLDIAGLPIRRQWYALHLADKRLSPLTTRFREFLLAQGRRVIAEAIEAPPSPPRRPRASRGRARPGP